MPSTSLVRRVLVCVMTPYLLYITILLAVDPGNGSLELVLKAIHNPGVEISDSDFNMNITLLPNQTFEFKNGKLVSIEYTVGAQIVT